MNIRPSTFEGNIWVWFCGCRNGIYEFHISHKEGVMFFLQVKFHDIKVNPGIAGNHKMELLIMKLIEKQGWDLNMSVSTFLNLHLESIPRIEIIKLKL